LSLKYIENCPTIVLWIFCHSTYLYAIPSSPNLLACTYL
jgi:hypothetical protein